MNIDILTKSQTKGVPMITLTDLKHLFAGCEYVLVFVLGFVWVLRWYIYRRSF